MSPPPSPPPIEKATQKGAQPGVMQHGLGIFCQPRKDVPGCFVHMVGRLVVKIDDSRFLLAPHGQGTRYCVRE